jgi:SsrA-binding protein
MGKKKSKKKDTEQTEGIKILLKNRKARFQYEILETYEAGIELKGTEVKSIRQSKMSVEEAYGRFIKDELYLIGMHIKPYAFGNRFNHDPLRKRKLLLHRRELDKLFSKVTEKGLTIVPLSIYLKKGLVKIQIGVCRGKKLYDKRETTKNREMQIELDRTIKGYNK